MKQIKTMDGKIYECIFGRFCRNQRYVLVWGNRICIEQVGQYMPTISDAIAILPSTKHDKYLHNDFSLLLHNLLIVLSYPQGNKWERPVNSRLFFLLNLIQVPVRRNGCYLISFNRKKQATSGSSVGPYIGMIMLTSKSAVNVNFYGQVIPFATLHCLNVTATEIYSQPFSLFDNILLIGQHVLPVRKKCTFSFHTRDQVTGILLVTAPLHSLGNNLMLIFYHSFKDVNAFIRRSTKMAH